MDEQKIRQIVRQEIAAGSSQARFGMNSTGTHTHDGINSPLVFQSTVVYIGLVNYDGTADALPLGWAVTLSSTGVYLIDHGLGSDSLYAVTASAIQSTNNVVTPIITNFSNAFYAVWHNESAVLKNTSFGFTLTVVNNRSRTPPSYGIASLA